VGKTFNFLVDDPKRGKWYLADAAGMGTQDVSKALACELVADAIKCGGKGFPAFSGDMTKLSTTGNSAGWSIDEADNIKWSARPNMKFSLGLTATSNELWAEVCPHHFTDHGTAKAIWIKEAGAA
jgi:hypothetical protein